LGVKDSTIGDFTVQQNATLMGKWIDSASAQIVGLQEMDVDIKNTGDMEKAGIFDFDWAGMAMVIGAIVALILVVIGAKFALTGSSGRRRKSRRSRGRSRRRRRPQQVYSPPQMVPDPVYSPPQTVPDPVYSPPQMVPDPVY
jgi:hypothetical protein